ncbi:MAG: alpha/beta fold hydrolase [Phycisphaerales bacterium]|nr:alpha/beta fold hydrolase [Phycisphaerales bacterium]
MKRAQVAIVWLLAGLAPVAAWVPGPPDDEKPGGFMGWVRGQWDEVVVRVERAVDQVEDEGRHVQRPRGVRLFVPAPDGVVGSVWAPAADLEAEPAHVVLLIHGLDEPGSVWDDVAPILRDAGHEVARFDYPNDQPIAESAALLGGSLRDLKARGVRQVDMVCHSMGGLVARDVLTRPGLYAGEADGHEDLPDVGRLITVGTPNLGSPWAKLRAIGEVREQVERFFTNPDTNWRDLLGYLSDGLGEAGDDLLPGSVYLTELNARPLPRDVTITIIAGCVAPVKNEDLEWRADSWLLRKILGKEDAEAVAAGITSLATDLGDGVVPVASTALPGVGDVVCVNGSNHRSLLKNFEVVDEVRDLIGAERTVPPAIPIILERLRQEP